MLLCLLILHPLLPVSILLLDFQLLQSELFLLVVKCKIVEEFGCSFEAVEDAEHSLAHFWENLLAVSALTSWLVVVERILDVDKLSVGNVLDLNPLDLDGASPLAGLLPKL